MNPPGLGSRAMTPPCASRSAWASAPARLPPPRPRRRGPPPPRRGAPPARLTLPPGTSLDDLKEARVEEVLDGDTIDVILDGRLTRVRYYGVDTPERGDRCFREATDRNESLVGGRGGRPPRPRGQGGPGAPAGRAGSPRARGG